MSNKLVVIGAGGDGRNIVEIIESMSNKWDIVGFLDDDKKKLHTIINGIPVIGTTSHIDKFEDCQFMVFVGNINTLFIKKKLINRLNIKPDKFAKIIHHKSTVSKYSTIGNGSVLLSGSVVMANAFIGNYCYITSNVNIGHDTIIEDYAFIAPLVGIPGNVKIEEGAYMGISSCVQGGVTIGKWSIVGMGSVVTKDVPPYHVVVGNPARVIRKRDISDFEF